MDRRTFLRRGLALVGVAAVGPLVERRAPVAEAHPALADPPLVLVQPPERFLSVGYAATLPEGWDIPDLIRIWDRRPPWVAAPAQIILSPADFTRYGNLLTGMKRWYPEGARTEALTAGFRSLTFYGVPVIERRFWPPGILNLQP